MMCEVQRQHTHHESMINQVAVPSGVVAAAQPERYDTMIHAVHALDCS